MNFEVIQDYCRCCHLIGDIRFHISLLSLSCAVFEILTLICQKKLRRHVILTTPIWGTVCDHETSSSGANPYIKFYDSIFSHSREIQGV